MPKETIYGCHLPFGTPEEPGPGRSVVEVRWGRDSEDVQVVTKCVDPQTGDRFVQDDKNETGVSIHYTDGFYVTLDRKGINELIRDLRKARDQAFGRDE